MGNYYLYRLGQFLARILPFGISSAVVTMLCDLHYCFSTADRRAVENNLKVLTGQDKVPASQVRAVFRHFGKYLLEFFTMTRRLNAGFIKSHVSIDHIEYLNEVLQKGKGAIVVSAHLGNWEMGGAVLPLMGFPLSVVALAHRDPRVNALFNAQRESFGMKVIQTDVAVRRVLEHLKKKQLVAILAERDFNTHGIMMDFLGSRAMIPKGAAFFSLKTGAPIVPIFFLRTKEDDFRIKVHPPIEPPHLPANRITEPAAVELIQKYLTTIEKEIRQAPSQWLIFREFWKS